MHSALAKSRIITSARAFTFYIRSGVGRRRDETTTMFIGEKMQKRDTAGEEERNRLIEGSFYNIGERRQYFRSVKETKKPRVVFDEEASFLSTSGITRHITRCFRHNFRLFRRCRRKLSSVVKQDDPARDGFLPFSLPWDFFLHLALPCLTSQTTNSVVNTSSAGAGVKAP